MQPTVYSFSDVQIVMGSPVHPAYVMNGQGIGEITIDPLNDNSAHDLAADGRVMISKILAKNASVVITVQQTSEFNRFLQGLYNALLKLPSNVWASISIDLVTPNEISVLTGVSFQRKTGRSYRQQGEMWSWNLMAAEWSTDGSVLNGIISEARTSAQIVNAVNGGV